MLENGVQCSLPKYCTTVGCKLLYNLFLQIRSAGVPAVLKFPKFQKCPEVVLKFEIVLKYYSFGNNVLKMLFDAQ